MSDYTIETFRRSNSLIGKIPANHDAFSSEFEWARDFKRFFATQKPIEILLTVGRAVTK